MLKKLIGVGMATALTFGFGFSTTADAMHGYGNGANCKDPKCVPDAVYKGFPYLGKDGHVYVSGPVYGSSGGVYKTYNLKNGIMTAVNVYDDTDIIHLPHERYQINNNSFIHVKFTEKNNNDYKIESIDYNYMELDGLLKDQSWNDAYDLYTYKVSWVDDNNVYLYTKNHPNPHEIKLPRDGFNDLNPGDWLWAKQSSETWKWVDYQEIMPGGPL